jgi:hypothetical protein
LNLPSSSILPKPLEPLGTELGVAHGVVMLRWPS